MHLIRALNFQLLGLPNWGFMVNKALLANQTVLHFTPGSNNHRGCWHVAAADAEQGEKNHTSPNFRCSRLQKPALNCCWLWNPLLLVETPRYTNRSSGLAAPGGMLPTQLSGWYLSCLQPACDTTAEMTLVCMRSQRWPQFDCTLTSSYKQEHKEKLKMEVGWSPYATSTDWLSSKAWTLSNWIVPPKQLLLAEAKINK